MYCDLHTHSTYSDGTLSPARLVEEAEKAGLAAVALTDHNTVDGLPEFLKAAEGRSVLAVPGVEISTGFAGRQIHLVGLFLEPECRAKTAEFLQTINLRKEESNRALVAKLIALGYRLDYDALRARQQGNINRAVIAAELMACGYIESVEAGFRGLLSRSHGVYVPPERLPTGEAVKFLRSVGALPVLAHPFLDQEEEEVRELLRELVPCGLVAMETRYSTYSPETTALARRIAEEYGLLESGGSDFHGETKPDIRLKTGKGDLCVPFRIFEKLKKAVQ